MRAAILTLLLLLGSYLPAQAAEGYQGRVSTSITLSDKFVRAADPYGRSGLDLDSFTIPPVTGVIYLSGQRMRLDTTLPGTTVTTILHGRGGYILDHGRKVAHRLPQISGDSELPLFSPDQLAADWDSLSERLAAVSGIQVSQLGSKTVNGERCRGLRFRGEISKLLSADEVQVAPGLPSLSRLRGDWQGTFWVSERIGLPMKITTIFSGISLVWQIAGLAKGDIPETLFALPPGYRVKELEDAVLAGPRDA